MMTPALGSMLRADSAMIATQISSGSTISLSANVHEGMDELVSFLLRVRHFVPLVRSSCGAWPVLPVPDGWIELTLRGDIDMIIRRLGWTRSCLMGSRVGSFKVDCHLPLSVQRGDIEIIK
jgi:hypothetical protein